MGDNVKIADIRSAMSTASIDVVLLAMVIALHVTRKDQNLKLLLVLLLVVHVVATTRAASPDTAAYEPEGGVDTAHVEPAAGEEVEQVVHAVQSGLGAAGATTVPDTVRSAGFDRQLSSPAQLSRTREVLPTSSNGANGKLVDSRTSFYKDIIDI